MVRIARRKLAKYVVDQLENGASLRRTVTELAAYLRETRRTREFELIVRDIEDQLAERGTIIADITSAYPLTEALRQAIQRTVGGHTVELREALDSSLIGGIRIDIPGQRYDGTIRRKLNALKAKQL